MLAIARINSGIQAILKSISHFQINSSKAVELLRRCNVAEGLSHPYDSHFQINSSKAVELLRRCNVAEGLSHPYDRVPKRYYFEIMINRID